MTCQTNRTSNEAPPARAGRTLSCLLATWLLAGCGYHHYAGPLQPQGEQGPGMVSADDGSVTFVKDRFEVRLRPLTDQELNRQFAPQSGGGPKSTNPYTYGDTEFYEDPEDRQRFTAFLLDVKNYAYPKVKIDPQRVQLVAANGREYWSLNLQQLDRYFRAYIIGYEGNAYARYRERRDLLLRTMYKNEQIFSGQESEGLIVFPHLHPDVGQVKVIVRDVVLRFDYRDEPLESIDITYAFGREVGREYPDGSVELSSKD
jgi:hypothetical protein